MTIQTAVLIQTLEALGSPGALGFVQYLFDPGSCRSGNCGQWYTGIRFKGESLDDYWEFTHRIFEWPDGGYSNMILDDGGDATLLLHLGNRAGTGYVGSRQSFFGRGVCLFNAIKRHLKEDSSWYSKRIREIKGVTEKRLPVYIGCTRCIRKGS